MTIHPSPNQNRLLAALPPTDYKQLLPHLELVELSLNTTLYKPSRHQSHAYFPITSIASLMSDLSDGTSIEFAMVGNEGMIGTSLFMGDGPMTTNRAAILCGGQAYRLNKQQFIQKFSQSNSMQYILLRYTQSLISQIAQTAVCNRHHSLDKQLCCLLLLIADRLPSNEINLTQELIANRLGVRREGITESAGRLQKSGLIRYSRGHIFILNRPKLEEKVCECYQNIKNDSDYSKLSGIHSVSS